MGRRSSTQPSDQIKTRLWSRLIGIVAVIGIVVGVVIAILPSDEQAAEQLVKTASQAFDRRDYAEALRLAEEALSRQPENSQAAIIAGRSAVSLQLFQQALEFFERIPDDGSTEAVEARNASGELLLLGMQRISPAEKQYRRALENIRTVALGPGRRVTGGNWT